MDLSKQTAYRKQWKKDNPHKQAEYRRRKKERDPEYRRCADMKHTYNGFACDDYKALSKVQFNRCAICGRTAEESKSRFNKLAIDHDHNTGAVRGLLCTTCNKGLGLFGDDPGRMQMAIDYLVTP